MRVFCSLLILTLGVLSPMLSCAADLSKWLVNLKREVTRLAIDERAHLHSIARMRNSVIGEEDLFLISDVDLGALDIQLRPGGVVSVAARRMGSPVSRAATKNKSAMLGEPQKCSSPSGKFPKLSLVFRNDLDREQLAVPEEIASLRLVRQFVGSVLTDEEGFRLFPYAEGASRYENLLRGNGFSRLRYELLVSLKYKKETKNTALSKYNPKHLFANSHRAREAHRVSVELQLFDDNSKVKGTRVDIALVEPNRGDLGKAELKLKSGLVASQDALKSKIIEFLSDAKCLVRHSNVVVALDGKLILGAGIDAGYAEGDQFLLIPKSSYLKKRGLLTGIEQIAIARISKIDDLESVLVVEEGAVRIETGAEFTVKPLLELI